MTDSKTERNIQTIRKTLDAASRGQITHESHQEAITALEDVTKLLNNRGDLLRLVMEGCK